MPQPDDEQVFFLFVPRDEEPVRPDDVFELIHKFANEHGWKAAAMMRGRAAVQRYLKKRDEFDRECDSLIKKGVAIEGHGDKAE